MNQIAKYATPGLVEKLVGLPGGSIDSFAWLVLQEQARATPDSEIAKALSVDVSELDLLADSVTGGTGGVNNDLWKAAIVSLRSISLANQHAIGAGWDALEAMAVDRLASVISDMDGKVTIKDAVAIAAMANKAVRRGQGEGSTRASLHVKAGSDGGGEMTLDVKGGNIGSIRLSLSTRIQEQLQAPRVINQEPMAERRMLTLEETRNVKSDSDT